MRFRKNLIIKYIKNHHLTVYSFANRAGLNGPTLWRILYKQKSLRVTTMIKIVKAMGLDRKTLYKIFSC